MAIFPLIGSAQVTEEGGLVIFQRYFRYKIVK
jgi:hypothetical protein